MQGRVEVVQVTDVDAEQPFGFDGLFGLLGGADDGEDSQAGGGDERKGASAAQTTTEATSTHPGRTTPTPRFRVEVTMCNPPFYGSAAEVEEGSAGKEAGPLGVRGSFLFLRVLCFFVLGVWAPVFSHPRRSSD